MKSPRHFSAAIALFLMFLAGPLMAASIEHPGSVPVLLGLDSVRNELGRTQSQGARLDKIRSDFKDDAHLITSRPLATPVEKAAAETVADVAEGASQIAAGALVDPLQLWGSLTQQFQQIAAGAVKEASAKTAVDVTKHMATGMAKEAMKSGKKAVGAAARRSTTSKPAAKVVRKTASRK